MKKLIAAAALLAAGTALSQAVVVLTLAESADKLSQTSTMGTSAANNVTKVKTFAEGAYAGGNQNSITETGDKPWGTNDEGKWVNTDNVGTITLLGRSGVSGDSFALVLKSGLTAGTT